MAAPFIPIPGIVQVTVKGVIAGVATANIFHVGSTFDTTAYSQSEVDGLALGVRNAYITRFGPLIGNFWTHSETVAADLHDELANVGVNTTAGAGTHGSVIVQANVAQGITWKIARRYRGGHPRTYLPPPGNNTAVLNNNSWATTHITALNTAATGFRTDVNALTAGSRGILLFAVHKVKNNVPINPRLVDQIIGSSVDSRCDSQRRRLGKDR